MSKICPYCNGDGVIPNTKHYDPSVTKYRKTPVYRLGFRDLIRGHPIAYDPTMTNDRALWSLGEFLRVSKVDHTDVPTYVIVKLDNRIMPLHAEHVVILEANDAAKVD